jgi:1,4-alpha-glucan branching enzyme
MIALAGEAGLPADPAARLLWEHNEDKVLIFERAGLIFAFNFHPARSFSDYRFAADPGRYRIALDSDAPRFGGHGRIADDLPHVTFTDGESTPAVHSLSLYLPSRTALVLKRTAS